MSRNGAKNTKRKGKRQKRPTRDGIQEVPSLSAKKTDAEAVERASTECAEARREAKQATMIEASKREAAEPHQKAQREQSARASANQSAAKAQHEAERAEAVRASAERADA